MSEDIRECIPNKDIQELLQLALAHKSTEVSASQFIKCLATLASILCGLTFLPFSAAKKSHFTISLPVTPCFQVLRKLAMLGTQTSWEKRYEGEAWTLGSSYWWSHRDYYYYCCGYWPGSRIYFCRNYSSCIRLGGKKLCTTQLGSSPCQATQQSSTLTIEPLFKT